MGVAEVFEGLVGGAGPVGFRAFDGSNAGPADAEVVLEIRAPRALAYLATSPGDLGLARAYVTGDLEVHGDVHTALTLLSAVDQHLPFSAKLRAVRDLGGLKLLLSRPELPAEEVRLHGRMHSKDRDRAAIAHHYDVSNLFYSWILGPSMAYTCAVYDADSASLEDAQFAKHDLVARKLDLKPGMRLLDVGCGWGGMVLHAAKNYGVRALGVTLSRRQAEWAQKAISEAGLSDLAEVRHVDYRDVTESGFDAISSIGLTEHIGRAQYPAYFQSLYAKLRPGGRLLNHCITRPSNSEPPVYRRAFINRYIFPDGEMSGPGHLMSVMNDAGFEIRHSENLREHYALTLAAWSRNMDAHWEESVAEVGLRRARVWRLYLAAARLGFERDTVQLHQMLGVKLRDGMHADVELRPDWR